jgi:hypothetical protein
MSESQASVGQSVRESEADLLTANTLIELLASRMASIESVLAEIDTMLGNRQPEKDWFTVREFAQLLDRSEFTVRE